ncbi:aminopeptidase N [Shewanella algidipiscicola]|nr:aminopeptidase N [Shewanella algidipiscicola]
MAQHILALKQRLPAKQRHSGLSLCIMAAAVLLLSACQSTPTTQPAHQAQDNATISAEQARSRANRISDIHYQLALDLSDNQYFSGEATISFSLNDNDAPLLLDLHQARLHQLTINGQRLYPNYDGQHLRLSPSLLNRGSNQVSLSYSHPYSIGDQGLIQAIDAVDGRRYLYSHLLPASAQRMMPVFDQPNLKAVFQLSVTAPSDWRVFSAAAEREQRHGTNLSQWFFAPSPPLSPHTFSLIAGPYHQWQSDEASLTLRLLARQSIAHQIDTDTWLAQTHQGLTFYRQQLGVDYPFNHYNQILVPHLPTQTMANAANATFAETAIDATPSLSLNLHTLAQQWFGNLVTLNWWDSFWLSQSLGILLANKAMIADPSTPAWYQDIHNVYQLDDKHSLTPPEQAVMNSAQVEPGVNQAMLSKGVALLTQLNYLVGDTAFNQGLQYYLEQHRFGNANLDDFIASLSLAAKRPLATWAQQWLYQAGVNRIEAQFQCSNGRISHFNLHQSASEQYPTLRQQKVKLGLFTLGRDTLHRNLVVATTYSGSDTEIKRLQGVRCPDLVFPNYQDWGYVQVQLDPESLTTALLHLSKVDEPKLRIMLWQTLWHSVTRGELTLDRFLGSVFINAPQEDDPQVLQPLLSQLRQAKALLEQMSPNRQHYSQRAMRALEQMSLRLTMSRQAMPEIQHLWLEAYIDFALSHQAKQHLSALLNGTEWLTGVELTPTLRWAMVIHLNRYDAIGAQRLLQQEKLRDSSPQAQMLALSAEVAQPIAAQKRQWFERIQRHNADADSQMLAKLLRIMPHLYPSEQKALSQATAEQRLNELAQLDKRNSARFMQAYNQYLLPQECSYASVARLSRLLNSEPDLSPVTLRGVKQAIEAEQACITIQQPLRQ